MPPRPRSAADRRARPSPRPRVAGERSRRVDDAAAPPATDRVDPTAKTEPTVEVAPATKSEPAAKTTAAATSTSATDRAVAARTRTRTRPKPTAVAKRAEPARDTEPAARVVRIAEAAESALAGLLPRPSQWTARAWYATAAGLAVLCAGLALFGGYLWQHGRAAQRSASSAVLADARTDVTALYNYDARTIDADIKAALAVTTAQYRTSFAKELTSTIKPIFTQIGATLAASDVSVALTSVNDAADQAEVVAFMTLTSTSIATGQAAGTPAQQITPDADCTATPGGTGQTCQMQVQLTLDLVGSRWKVSDLSRIQGVQPGTGGAAPTG